MDCKTLILQQPIISKHLIKNQKITINMKILDLFHTFFSHLPWIAQRTSNLQTTPRRKHLSQPNATHLSVSQNLFLSPEDQLMAQITNSKNEILGGGSDTISCVVVDCSVVRGL